MPPPRNRVDTRGRTADARGPVNLRLTPLVELGLRSPARPPSPVGRGSFAALIAGAGAIGFAPIFVRLSEVGPSATAFWRILLATPVLWGWLLAARRADPAPARPISRADAWGLAGVGALFAGDLAFWHWSIHLTSVANATLLANFAPIYVVAFGWLAWGRRFSGRFLLAMAAALTGATLLLGGDLGVHAHSLAGTALGLITAGFYAGYLTLVGALRQRFSTIAVMAWSSLVSGAILLPVALCSREAILPPSARGWGTVLALALVSHVGGQGLIAYALARLPGAFVAVGLLVQPVTAAVAAWLLLGEGIGPWQVAGMALVLAGVFMARRENLAR